MSPRLASLLILADLISLGPSADTALNMPSPSSKRPQRAQHLALLDHFAWLYFTVLQRVENRIMLELYAASAE